MVGVWGDGFSSVQRDNASARTQTPPLPLYRRACMRRIIVNPIDWSSKARWEHFLVHFNLHRRLKIIPEELSHINLISFILLWIKRPNDEKYTKLCILISVSTSTHKTRRLFSSLARLCPSGVAVPSPYAAFGPSWQNKAYWPCPSEGKDRSGKKNL